MSGTDLDAEARVSTTSCLTSWNSQCKWERQLNKKSAQEDGYMNCCGKTDKKNLWWEEGVASIQVSQRRLPAEISEH